MKPKRALAPAPLRFLRFPVRSVVKFTRRSLPACVLLFALSLNVSPAGTADQGRVLKSLPYKSAAGLSNLEENRCRLDLYLPEATSGFPVLVWFHGGGLTEGSKDGEFSVRIAQHLATLGVGVAMVNYRLSPQVQYPAYIEDAAAAVAWISRHIAEHAGDPRKVFVGGHSAGAYLALMVGLDPGFLKVHRLDTTAIAGLIPVSGQTMTHDTVRERRGLDKNRIIADEAAPIHHVRKDAPPILSIVADDDLPARAEENSYLAAALKAAGHNRVLLRTIANRDHGTVAGKIAEPNDPAASAILSFIKEVSGKATAL